MINWSIKKEHADGYMEQHCNALHTVVSSRRATQRKITIVVCRSCIDGLPSVHHRATLRHAILKSVCSRCQFSLRSYFSFHFLSASRSTGLRYVRWTPPASILIRRIINRRRGEKVWLCFYVLWYLHLKKTEKDWFRDNFWIIAFDTYFEECY